MFAMDDSIALLPRHRDWTLEDIPYASVKPDCVRTDKDLFYLLTAASFVEITSDWYTRNLIEYFQGDAEVEAWLKWVWEPQELRHGKALKRYIQRVWPDFDWEQCYSRFTEEFSQFCKVEKLGPTRALEMASRCLVETGTATLYTMIHRLTREPVLRLLTANIRADEICHFKYFYRYFLRYRDREHTRPWEVLGVLYARSVRIDNEDAYYAFKHVFEACHPNVSFHDDEYKTIRSHYLKAAKHCYPLAMAVKMSLKPMGLNRALSHTIVPLVIAALKALYL
jgi:hypothetical protein